MNEKNTEAQAVAELALQGRQPIRLKTPTGALLVFPQSEKIIDMERYEDTPTRKRGAVVVTDYQSFIKYVEAHREEGTTIFAELDETGGKFVAAIDYHHANTEASAGLPRWIQHTCTLQMKHTPEWKRWTNLDDQAMEQTEFAQFLEDNRLDISQPIAAEIIDIAKSMEAESGSRFKSAVRLDNGDRKILFETETNARAGATGEMIIPEIITMKLPVFVNGPSYDIAAFFRYKVSNPLKLRYKLIRPNKVIELALEETRQAIESTTKLPCLSGRYV